MTIQPTRSDALENRRRIMLAAREIFAEEGMGAEMKAIAERAGVGVGTVYRNFATKEGLVVAMIGDLMSEFRQALEAVEAVEDVAQALVRLLTTGWRMAEQSGGLFLALAHGGVDPRGLSDDLLERVTRLMQRGIDSGTLRQDVGARFMAEYVEATIPGVYLQLRMVYGPEEAAEQCTRMLLGAMLAPGVEMEPLMAVWRSLS
jgi:AcrR family transcriptional regulator